MKILRFNESTTTQYITCVITEDREFITSGTFYDKIERDNWLLKVLNDKLDLTYNDVNDARYAFEIPDEGTEIFDIISNEHPSKYICVVSDHQFVSTVKDYCFFDNIPSLKKWIINYMNNLAGLEFENALEAIDWYSQEYYNGNVYWGETILAQNEEYNL